MSSPAAADTDALGHSLRGMSRGTVLDLISDIERGLELARRVQTGSIGINTYLPDPVAPFGGVKHSGIGRGLGPEGLTNYQQLRSIHLTN